MPLATWLVAGAKANVNLSELRSDWQAKAPAPPLRPKSRSELRSEGQAGRPVLPLIHAAHAGSGAASAGGAGGHVGALGGAVGAGGEGGELLLEVLLAAGRADKRVHVGGAADQLFELGSAIGTKVFVDRHGVVSPYSNIRVQMRSMTPRTSVTERPP